jgi:LacI family transcriptional regulator
MVDRINAGLIRISNTYKESGVKPRRVTQNDVAQLAGVSQATVSMVLSGTHTEIPAETFERISAAAKQLGYLPNRFAQALKTNRTMTIACMVPDITNPFYPALMRGIQSVSEAHGYDVIAVNTDGLAERERHFLNWSLQGRVDGVIGVFRPVVSGGVPVVRIESGRKSVGDIPLDNIYVDSRAGSIAMVHALVAKGHYRIAMIAGRGGPQRVRVDGYSAALLEAGGNPDVVLDDAFNEEGGFRAAQAILSRKERPTAIFAANDMMAIGAMQALRMGGVNIPGDIAVAGFDDISAARLVSPALTTVAQHQHEVGIRAAEILMDRIKGRVTGMGTAVEMPFTLIERGST